MDKRNEKLSKINVDLWEEIQMMEDETEDWINRCESIKELHSNILAKIQILNQKLEEKDEVMKSNKILEIEINKKRQRTWWYINEIWEDERFT